MSIPSAQSLMLPVLEILSGGKESLLSELREHVASAEGLTRGDLQERTAHGGETLFANRVGWAVKYLKEAGAVKQVRRGTHLSDNG